jgi:hypothetical protein
MCLSGCGSRVSGSVGAQCPALLSAVTCSCASGCVHRSAPGTTLQPKLQRTHQGDTLRWLIESGCPFNAESVCTGVVSGSRSGSLGSDLSALQFLYDHGTLADAAMLTHALNVAGSLGRLPAAQWLRQRGAEWPPVLHFNSNTFEYTWEGEVLLWARAEGCTSPTEPAI